jgi:hypothetical protein
MISRQIAALTLITLVAAACGLRDQNIVDESTRPAPTTSSGASSGTSGGGSGSNTSSGASGTSSGTTTKDGGTSGSSGTSGASGGSSGMSGPMCEAGALVCNGGCASPADPAFGCGNAACTPCALANTAKHSCDKQACAVDTCAATHADCNKVPGDGCEVVLAADPQNCGACGVQCAPEATCNAGKCTCADPGLTNCGNPGVCVNTSFDRNNCGMCGKVCQGNEQCSGNGQCVDFGGGGI